MPETPMLRIQELGHDYGDGPVLTGVSLEVNAAELVAVLGTSGSGKSTLLRSVAGFVTPQRGTIQIAGRTVTEAGRERVPAESRGVGMVFQDHALFAHMTIAENVRFGIHREADALTRVQALLKMVGLQGLADRLPGSLSGGQQQRVALARALAPRPSLLVLDEPFANLDAPLRRGIGIELQEILREQGVSALLVTHERSEALALADRVAILDAAPEGGAQLVQVARPEEVHREPATAGAAHLTGPVTLIPCEANGSTATCVLGSATLLRSHAGECQLVIRPEQVTLTPDPTGHLITSRRFEGAGYTLDIDTPAGPLLAWTPPESALLRGARVAIQLEGRHATVA